MENLFLLEDQNLCDLSIILGITTESLVDKVHSGLVISGIELCDNETPGLPIQVICEKNNLTLRDFANLTFDELNSSAMRLLGSLKFMHVNEDCPVCGHSIKSGRKLISNESVEGVDDFGLFDISNCTNYACNYEVVSMP